MMKTKICQVVLAIICTACGLGKKGGQPPSPPQGPLAKAFSKASNEHGIPEKLLLAVGFNESGMSVYSQNSQYGLGPLGLGQTETAFGQSKATLGLSQDAAFSPLETQVQAYAQWLKLRLEDQRLKLSPKPEKPQEIFEWIWNIAALQRDPSGEHRNIRAIYAMEIIEKLNKGQRYQDPESGEILVLEAASEAISAERFPPESQQSLSLLSDEGAFSSVRYLELSDPHPERGQNQGKGIRLIHCPLSLSACLDLQNAPVIDGQAKLAAHYVIPHEKLPFNGMNKVLQVAQHRQVLELTNAEGITTEHNGQIIVMLTGPSGTYVKGQRLRAEPIWYTEEQLLKFSNLIRQLCPLLKYYESGVSLDSCHRLGGNGGIEVDWSDGKKPYQWGQMVDIDAPLLDAYLRSPQGLAGQAQFEWAKPDRIFKAGDNVEFKLRFLTGTSRIEIQKAERCAGGSLVWTTLQAVEVRATSLYKFQTQFFYQGPNGDGRHFLRARVYGPDGQLTSWNQAEVLIRDFEIDQLAKPEHGHCPT